MKKKDGAMEILFHIKAVFTIDTDKNFSVISGSISDEQKLKIIEGFMSTSML